MFNNSEVVLNSNQAVRVIRFEREVYLSVVGIAVKLYVMGHKMNPWGTPYGTLALGAV